MDENSKRTCKGPLEFSLIKTYKSYTVLRMVIITAFAIVLNESAVV